MGEAKRRREKSELMDELMRPLTDEEIERITNDAWTGNQLARKLFAELVTRHVDPDGTYEASEGWPCTADSVFYALWVAVTEWLLTYNLDAASICAEIHAIERKQNQGDTDDA